VTSLWDFTSKINLTFSHPLAWTPPLPRQNDMFLVDFFVSLAYPRKVLATLNHSRLYLQALTLSDIIAANGQYILPTARDGIRINTRLSLLQWPAQDRNTSGEWSLWKSALSQVETHGRLKTPLGLWVHATHQQWDNFLDEQSGAVYMITGSSIRKYSPILSNVRTRFGP
jgi:hypothetical protein